MSAASMFSADAGAAAASYVCREWGSESGYRMGHLASFGGAEVFAVTARDGSRFAVMAHLYGMTATVPGDLTSSDDLTDEQTGFVVQQASDWSKP